MPYPNEHSARLKNPKLFDKGSYRRTTDGTLYGKIKVPKTVSVIWGKLIGKSKPKDPPIAQALRFPVKNWTADKAKGWLKKNKIKFILFEAAKKSKKENSTMYNKDTIPTEIPQDAFTFDMNGEGTFFSSEEDKNNVRLMLYDGSIINHWFWGNLAFDLKGMKLEKSRIPILYRHDTDQRLGFSTNASFEGKFILEGKLLDSDVVKGIKSDAIGGFPFEASMKFNRSKVKLRIVREGESVKVNGKLLRGPGTIMLESKIMEGSVCVFGLHNNCKTNIYEVTENEESDKGEHIMDTIAEMTPETLQAENPDLYSKIFDAGKADGEKGERDLFAELKKVCGDDNQLLITCFDEGKSQIETLTLRNEKLEKEKTELTEKAKKAGEKKVDPANQEFTDEQTETSDDSTKLTGEALWKDEYAKSETLQDQFKSEDAYVAFKKHDEAGEVHISSGQK